MLIYSFQLKGIIIIQAYFQKIVKIFTKQWQKLIHFRDNKLSYNNRIILIIYRKHMSNYDVKYSLNRLASVQVLLELDIMYHI